MRAALAALAEQAARQENQQAQIDLIADLAGVGPQIAAIKARGDQRVAALRRRADKDNPAQSVPEPSGEGPAQTTEDALGDVKNDQPSGGTATDDLMTPGETSEANTAPAATDSVSTPGASIEHSLDLNKQDVTKPVSGTEGPRPTEEVRTEVDVRVRDGVQTETAFPLEGDFANAQKVQSSREDQEPRLFASLRLARLQIQAGIEEGDDLAVAHKIASSDATDEEISSTIATLAAVAQAQPRQASQAQPQRRLVPARTARSMPSFQRAPEMATTAAQDFGLGADEALFE